jgi:hypothetical protein
MDSHPKPWWHKLEIIIPAIGTAVEIVKLILPYVG